MKRRNAPKPRPKTKARERELTEAQLEHVTGGAWNCYVEVSASTTGDVSG